MKHENQREIGDTCLFEYHCWESPESCDAEIWYRSHQKVEVVGYIKSDGEGIYSQEERFENGVQLLYKVKFQDGLEWEVFEDELLDREEDYLRPNPPKNN